MSVYSMPQLYALTIDIQSDFEKERENGKNI
jgi:hypothetical protein